MVTLLAFRLLLLLLLLTTTTFAADDDNTAADDNAAAAADDNAAAAAEPPSPSGSSSSSLETSALLTLKKSFTDPTGKLDSWSPSTPTPPCDTTRPWPGAQCYKGILVGIRLTHMNLTGTFDFAAISHLPRLHSVNLKHNALSGPIPPSLGTDERGLRALYLSYNSFSGPIPPAVFANMRWLKKLYLDNNKIAGPLPAAAIAAAPRLIELHLDHNEIDGPVPPKLPESLKRFNVSHNRLSGWVPPNVAARFEASSFAGNAGLCGSTDAGSDAVCVGPGPAIPPAMPPPTAADYMAMQEETSVFVVIGIILLVILLVTGAMVLMLRQDERNNSAATAADYYAAASAAGSAGGGGGGSSGGVSSSSSKGGGSARGEMVAVEVTGGGGGSSHGGGGGGASSAGKKMGELVLLSDEVPAFGLPDLMKASAEVLGNGTLGSAYKAAMRNGFTVAVKRLRDMNRVGREEFEQHVHMLAGLRHPNILPPAGFHYRKEEKLLVSQYMPRGSLLYILHGDQSPNRVVMDWEGRLRVAVGVVRGLAFLHEKLGIPTGRLVSMSGDDFDAPPPPPPHGNLKSGNILLDDSSPGGALEPRLVDYGFFPLVNTAQAPQAMFAFRSPEGTTRGVVSPRSDVYCLGVVLLELVTGRFPSQYLLTARGGTDVVHWAATAVAEGGEKELVDPSIAVAGGDAAVRLLRVGVHCASPEPECRPSVAEAAWMVEEIGRGGGGGAP